jgi:hypothetical protein
MTCAMPPRWFNYAFQLRLLSKDCTWQSACQSVNVGKVSKLLAEAEWALVHWLGRCEEPDPVLTNPGERLMLINEQS